MNLPNCSRSNSGGTVPSFFPSIPLARRAKSTAAAPVESHGGAVWLLTLHSVWSECLLAGENWAMFRKFERTHAEALHSATLNGPGKSVFKLASEAEWFYPRSSLKPSLMGCLLLSRAPPPHPPSSEIQHQQSHYSYFLFKVFGNRFYVRRIK